MGQNVFEYFFDKGKKGGKNKKCRPAAGFGPVGGWGRQKDGQKGVLKQILIYKKKQYV